MIYRIDVRPRGGDDPLGNSVQQQIAELGKAVDSVQTSRIFLIDTDAGTDGVERIARELLADPVVESAEIFSGQPSDAGRSRIEVHLKPGVMDPVAASTEMAIRDLGLDVRQVRTGRAFLLAGKFNREELRQIAGRVLANGVIESVHFEPVCPDQFETGRENPFVLRRVNLRQLTQAELMKLSREGHLFLSLGEMETIQEYFRRQQREPTDIELETLAQTWSEHCVHKTLKSAVEVEERDEQGRVISSRRYGNLIKDTIFSSTMRLMEKENPQTRFCLSVFKDNAGVVAFDETDAVCFKVETHNHPSAIEPYGGAATGSGGVIRDVLGTGLAAKPFANTDIFCVAFPDHSAILPKGVIHPKRILRQVVAGVRDYGNRMGIPTVNGAVYFDEGYLGNPLVFCGCAGLIPRNKIEKAAHAGDAIVLMGGRTGRDGIHGATFSSAELTDTHADEFSHAVQIGNAITEKKMTDVILAARDLGLFSAITDCGAGGLSSAVGEMGEKIGASVDLEKVPLKYAGLRYHEIWISEAQERMVLAAPPRNVARLLQLAAAEDVEATVIGTFGTDQHELILHYAGKEVGRLAMDFLHQGIPMPTRKAAVVKPQHEVHAAMGGIPFSPSPCTQGEGGGEGEFGSAAPFDSQNDPHPNPPPEYRERGQGRNPPPLATDDNPLSPSPCTQGEGGGEGEFGSAAPFDSQNDPHPNPPPEYRERGQGRNPPPLAADDNPLSPSPCTQGEGGGEGEFGSASPFHSRNDPHPNPLPEYRARGQERNAPPPATAVKEKLLALLSHPNIASKHWIIRQYDHEVQGGSVVKPLVGPMQMGPSDAAVLRPKLGTYRGVVLGCGLVPAIEDPYDMALASIDEAIRNVVAVGADPDQLALLDNFCWPSADDELTMGSIVRACEACRDAALAYGIPFISGKDSLHNQFTNQETGQVLRIPPTLLISAIGIIADVRQCVTMDLKQPGNTFSLIRTRDKSPAVLGQLHRRLHEDIAAGRIAACHDISDGGPLVAAAEMCIASGFGLDLDLAALGGGPFDEPVGEYLVECRAGDNPVLSEFQPGTVIRLGKVSAQPRLADGQRWSLPIDDLRSAWRKTLDW